MRYYAMVPMIDENNPLWVIYGDSYEYLSFAQATAISLVRRGEYKMARVYAVPDAKDLRSKKLCNHYEWIRDSVWEKIEW